ncbi:MAG: glycosyltransferase family protein [Acidobacteriales bacterium]|nr:glycosyltransferase family protein [Terriglobales bacterium]
MPPASIKTVAIIQARMGSTRLPGKVLMDIAGEPMLARAVKRTRRARSLASVMVATTDLSEDDAIAALCSERGWACFRGSEADVLDRYYQAALKFDAQAVVRITSDCPLTDPGLIDKHVELLASNWGKLDFVTNMMRPTFPLGLAVEAMPFEVLETMKRLSQTAELKEHVTTLAYVEPDRFRIGQIVNSVDLSHLRWTVDTAEDIEVVRRIFQEFGRDGFSWEEALSVMNEHPDWAEINRNVVQKIV